jgi:ATP-binding cassette subfamily B protein
VAMQDVFLFSDTIEGNIAYGIPEVSVEKVHWAADMAGARDFIETFSDGYDTIIGERGLGLSGGQRQRVAMARALCIKPTILVLDDSTSAVDMETEFLIQKGLEQVMKGRTTFVIAHRISSVKNADIIVVLENGQIAEQGNHASLLKEKGLYYQMYMDQYKDFASIGLSDEEVG